MITVQGVSGCPIHDIDEMIDLIESETDKKLPHNIMKIACGFMDCCHTHRGQIIDVWENLSHIKHK